MRAHRASPQEDRADGSDRWFAHAVEALASGTTDRLRERIAGVEGLSGPEAWVVYRDARSHLLAAARQRLSRVLLLELHAASLAGELGRGDERDRWSAFVELAATPAFRTRLAERYPALLDRLDDAARNSVEAVGTLAERLVTDRDELERLVGEEADEAAEMDEATAASATAASESLAPRALQLLGELRGLRLGAGDPHRGGHTVSRLEFAGGTLMYKPRPLEVDAALDSVLAALLPGPDRIRTARTLVRDGYGWTVFVEHRHCADDAETALFYTGLGRWLAVMRLIGGTDLHAENIVAHGPVPVVVDAETMLAPPAHAASVAAGEGDDGPGDASSAAAVAARILRRGVLRSGILPMRVDLLSGIDVSAAGRLTGEQPALTAPTIADGGTDSARLVNAEARIVAVRNHPNPDPEPERFWERIVAGFLELSTLMRELDAEGRLAPLLAPFLGCKVRQVVRSTQVYGDIRRMLWHPAALHDEAAAVEHARTALLRHAHANPVAPSDQATIDAEVAELLVGDTPVFTTHVDDEQVTAAVSDWRAADLELEARLIRFTLAGVYRDGLPSARAAVRALPLELGVVELDDRRRELAADAMRTLRDTAIRGSDGTVTWIGPVIGEKGWAVRALECDLHSGQAGVALCLAGYAREVAAGHAERVEGISELLPGTLAALRAAENRRRSHRIGALVGLAGQVWTWTALSRLTDDRALLDRAVRRAALLGKGLRAGDGRWRLDWSGGLAGTVTPLLDLAGATGDGIWLDVAASAAELLVRIVESGDAEGKALMNDAGFAHGRAGIGWALHRIAASSAGDGRARERWRAAAEEVFDPVAAVERAADEPGWCRGVAGIGLAACDLAAVVGEGEKAYVDAAYQAAERLASNPGYDSRSLCHGAAGEWEFLAAAARVVPGPAAPDRGAVDAALIRRLSQEPETASLIASAVSPGLLNGVAGTVVTLLRMHPGHEVPSPLLLGT